MTRTNDRSLGRGGLQRRTVLKGGAAAAGILAFGGPALAQSEPQRGGTLRVAQGADAQPKNVLAGRAGNNIWRFNVTQPLTYLDPENGKPKPILATDWDSSEDGKTFRIRLRDDVKFHTGRPFTAEDVVFTLEQVLIPANASQMRPLVAQLKSFEATGPHEVTITSDTPVAPRIFDVFELAVIVDKETFAGLADGSQVIGTGPYKWEEWVPGASIRLVRNEDYWGEGAYLDAIEVSIISDSTAMANAMRGRVDLALDVTPRDAIMFQGDPNVELFEGNGGVIYPLGIDVTAAPFDNKTLRQAIGFAIDRERIIDQVFNGVGDGSPLWWRSNEPGTTEAQTTWYHYDPDKAREMIKAAGAEGAEVPIRVIGLGAVPSIYEIVQNNLREVGLNPTGEVLEVAAFDEGQTAGELGPVFQQIHGLQGFSAATLSDALPALRPGNPSKFDPPKYRELKDKAQAAATPEDYAAAVKELAEFMLDEAFSHILVHTPPLHARTPKVNGLLFDNVGYLDLEKAWLG